MKTVLIIHGIGGHAGIHWQQWLHDELKSAGFNVLMPDLPESDRPDRQTWLNEIKSVADKIAPKELIIVGHSLGVTTALDYIEQLDASINGLVCVSGFAEAYGFDLNEYFMQEKKLDFSKITPKLSWAEVVYSDNDPYVTQEALKLAADGLGVEPVIVSGAGHLNSETGYTRFPLLLDLIKDKA